MHRFDKIKVVLTTVDRRQSSLKKTAKNLFKHERASTYTNLRTFKHELYRQSVDLED